MHLRPALAFATDARSTNLFIITTFPIGCQRVWVASPSPSVPVPAVDSHPSHKRVGGWTPPRRGRRHPARLRVPRDQREVLLCMPFVDCRQIGCSPPPSVSDCDSDQSYRRCQFPYRDRVLQQPTRCKFRKSSCGLIEPTVRSSSAYFRQLKWKPPSFPSSIR